MEFAVRTTDGTETALGSVTLTDTPSTTCLAFLGDGGAGAVDRSTISALRWTYSSMPTFSVDIGIDNIGFYQVGRSCTSLGNSGTGGTSGAAGSGGQGGVAGSGGRGGVAGT